MKGAVKKIKRIGVVVLVLALVFAFAACNSQNGSTSNTSESKQTSEQASSAESETTENSAGTTDDFDPSKIKLAIAMPVLNHPVHRTVQLGFVEACKDLGYQYQIVGTDGSDNNEVTAAAEAAAAGGAKGIVLWAQEETMLPCISTLKNDYGCVTCVPHFQWQQDEAVGLDINLGCVAETYARAVADYMAEKLEGKTGSIALTQYAYNKNENAASAAFKARIEELQAEGKLQGIKVLEPAIEGGADLTESTDVNVSIIQANPDIIAAVSWTGNGPVTWSNAARKCGYKAGDILIVSMDYTADNLTELKSGYVSALVAQPLYDEAYQAVCKIDKILRGESVDYWTELDAPLIYMGGEGIHDPARYEDILNRVSTTFED